MALNMQGPESIKFQDQQALSGRSLTSILSGSLVRGVVLEVKGDGYAEKILDEAKKAGIPIVEDPTLVAVLLGVGLGEEIPEEAYLAVARILVFLHNVDMGRRGGANGGNVP